MAKRSNGEGSSGWIMKNGHKYWRIRITVGYDPVTGKQKRKEIFGKTQKEAKEKLKEYELNNASNSDNSTLGNFYNDWLWNVKKTQLKPSTFEKWEGIYRNYIKDNRGLNNAKSINKIKINPVEGIIYPKNYEVQEETTQYINEFEQKELIKALRGDTLEGLINL